MNLPLTFYDLIKATMHNYGIGAVEAVTILKGQLDHALHELPPEEEQQP